MSDASDLARSTWELEDAPRLLRSLCEHAGLELEQHDAAAIGRAPAVMDIDRLDRWIERFASVCGVEAVPVTCRYSGLDDAVARSGPAIVAIPNADDPMTSDLYAVLGGRRGRVRVLGPDGRVRRMRVQRITETLFRRFEAGDGQLVQNLADAGIDRDQAKSVDAAIRELRWAAREFRGIWQLRGASHASIPVQLKRMGVFGRVATIIATHGLLQALVVAGWTALGVSALSGVADPAYLWAWVLALIAQIPLFAMNTRLQGELSLRLGSWIKGQLFTGSLRLGADELRGQGIGSFLARIYESEALESLILRGGLMALLAVVEVAVGIGLVVLGGAGSQLLALAVWAACAIPLYLRNWTLRREWTDTRIDITGRLVESMLGHRTRAVQLAPRHWHDREDEQLKDYHGRVRRLDRTNASIAVLPALWMALGVLGLLPGFVFASLEASAIAVGIGAQLYLLRALTRLDLGFRQLVQARIAWERVGDAFAAALQPPAVPAVWQDDPKLEREGTVCECRGLGFAHGPGRAILSDLNLRVKPGERLLLTGASGSGKTTLAALVAGEREPQVGSIACHGFDRASLGSLAWRQSIVYAPQFHENHIFAQSLAFNLLLGRAWPPEPHDFAEAMEVCHAVGLGPLVQRMPSGLNEPVGETGWQLSHGERSRIFLARALLQNSPLIILDESFGALDPMNVAAAMRCVLERARTAIVIAHP